MTHLDQTHAEMNLTKNLDHKNEFAKNRLHLLRLSNYFLLFFRSDVALLNKGNLNDKGAALIELRLAN